MKISKNQIFNLMDTNGRRGDVIYALQDYLRILNDIQINRGLSWGNLPNNLSQYLFYKGAIQSSPDVFSTHGPYDSLLIELEKHLDFNNAVEECNIQWIIDNKDKYKELIKLFDKGIEDRARHYTSNLVKLGLTDESRNITEVGKNLLEIRKIKRDSLEKTLPLDDVNITYLRQLLKLRIFEENTLNYYSPFCMALYILLKNERFNESDFLEIIQGSSSLSDINKIDSLIENYKKGDVTKDIEIEIPVSISNDNKIENCEFLKLFKNQKSSKTIEIYWDFYECLFNFNDDKDITNLNNLIEFYEKEKNSIDKAFGSGLSFLFYDKESISNPTKFINKNPKIFNGVLNDNIYTLFAKSKRVDQIKEYSDTTKRIFKATGVISFENGYVELEYKEIFEIILKTTDIKSKIFGNLQEDETELYSSYEEYEKNTSSFYCSETSISKIMEYSEDDILHNVNKIQEVLGNVEIDEISDIISYKRKMEFDNYINLTFPKEKVKEILLMFNGRNNDKEIKKLVSPDASVSTIYEFLVGIAWYYFSNKTIDLLKSFNLTLSANFEPLLHAGGGQGDIVIYEEKRVILLEATLMNKNSQKRGEWEPVLRHSVNLKVEEENKATGRDVISFFIADEFDSNTINIWRAISSVPLQSSLDKSKFTDNVVIMPINTNELCELIDKSTEYDKIIEMVKGLFEVEKKEFDLNWRNNLIDEII